MHDITDVEATLSCNGVLIVYAPGEGQCDRGRNCPPKRVATRGMNRSWKSCQASSCSR